MGLGDPDAGDVWEIMGMEHDVTEDPGSWIWARWRGFVRCLVGYLGAGVAVGDHVEVTPRAAGLPTPP